MTAARTVFRTLLLAALPLAACRGGADAGRAPARTAAADTVGADAPPVALGGVTPVEYPRALWRRGVEGTVVLRLVVDSTGAVPADSARVAESSGSARLDSAALAAAPRLRFAPALRQGRPVAAAVLQPVEFRRP
ncbi:MAG TPA: energy transducer TonB [Gemmatimonadales bacterium]|nr:energy transducer TonB [Gemmatimonadales bacterium]